MNEVCFECGGIVVERKRTSGCPNCNRWWPNNSPQPPLTHPADDSEERITAEDLAFKFKLMLDRNVAGYTSRSLVHQNVSLVIDHVFQLGRRAGMKELAEEFEARHKRHDMPDVPPQSVPPDLRK